MGELREMGAVTFVFAAGLLVSSFIYNTYLMKKPLSGEKMSMSEYFSRGSPKNHFFGWLGGAIWCLGFSLMTLAADKAGPAISYGLGQGATMVAVLWGVVIWKEFRMAPPAVNKYLVAMFVFYLGGLSLIIIARQ